jgi:RimJ/RimL family protein N-acetyltransferase
MTVPLELRTPRLRLRRWRPADRAPFAVLNADPRVMEYFVSTLSREESDAVVDRIQNHFERHGFGLWAAEIPDETDFAGFIGLFHCSFEAHFTPAAEIGWRLAVECWNRGYATEGARAALAFGLDRMQLDEIVSLTAVGNMRSRRVMEKINLPVGHSLRRHVLYRTRRMT